MNSTSETSLVASWEDPPPMLPTGRTRADERPWQQLADALRARPNEWAALTQDVPVHFATQIASARLSAFRPAGAFEAVTRNGSVYVRHVGESQ